MHLLRQTIERRRGCRQARQLLGYWDNLVQKDLTSRIQESVDHLRALAGGELACNPKGCRACGEHARVVALGVNVLDDDLAAELTGIY